MSERAKNVLIAAACAVLALLVIALVATGESTDDRVERIGSSIRCPVCQGESIADSPATMAVDMMSLIEERVDAGRSDGEIVDELLGSFSGAVLLDPPASGSTLLLWLAPLAALMVGVMVIIWWKRHPDPPEVEVDPAPTRSGRRLVGGLVLIGGFVAIVVVASALLQDRSDVTSGAADVSVDDLDNVSNDTMEAVISANVDNPEIDGMRLALAERYFSSGDFRSAFPHFLAVAQSPTADREEATLSLIRLGWMAYDGNGEVDTATELLDQALEITPNSPVALYLKGQVLWCGAGDSAGAAELFEEVLGQTNLPGETRETVEADLARLASGGACL
jgi:cytochrome c-type biogenesis protein CcmH